MKPTPSKLQIKKFRFLSGDFWISSRDGFQTFGWMLRSFEEYKRHIDFLLTRSIHSDTPLRIFNANPIVPFENSENTNADVSTIS